MLRGELGEIILGAVFLFIGLAACSVAAIGRRSGARLFIWFGIWSAMYGATLLTHSRAVVAALPHSLQVSVPYANTVIAYLIVVVASFAFLELSLGRFRRFIEIVIIVAVFIALAGIGWIVFGGGSADKFILYNNLLTICVLLVLVTVVAVKKLSDRYLVLLNRRVLAVGTLTFAIEALWTNLSRFLHYQTPRLLDHLSFAVFLLSFGYVGVQIILVRERRLLSIENELAVARQLQFSILPPALRRCPTCGLRPPTVR